MFFLFDWKTATQRLSQWLHKVPRPDSFKFADFLAWLDIEQHKKWLAAGSLLFFVVLAFAVYGCMGTSGSTRTAQSTVQTEKIYIRVAPGMTSGDIGTLLQKQGVISSKIHFWIVARLNGADNKFQSGKYALHRNMEDRDVLQVLIAGSDSVERFTIPEGYNVNEIAKRLSDEGIVDKTEFLEAAKKFAPYDYMKADSRAQYRAEGFLFPDTYEISSDASAEDILHMMAKNFDRRLTPEMRSRAAEMNLSIYDLVTMAALVEKEARFAEDRPIIAQVFFKRLQIGMPLQTDTTIQYLLDAPKEDVSVADTKIDSPYNTYQHKGLPPGPIANPGLAAIQAVLYPADTDYLYFVADRQGHNHYSMTYDEHLSIVNQVR